MDPLAEAKPVTGGLLFVTSRNGDGEFAMHALAALEANHVQVRAVDVGDASSPSGVASTLRAAMLAEALERKLRKVVAQHQPSVALAMDSEVGRALSVVRDAAAGGLVVVVALPALTVVPPWASVGADRFVVADEHAAYQLVEAGVEGDRIVVAGVSSSAQLALALAQSKVSLKARFGLRDRVLGVCVSELAPTSLSQLLLQLSLLELETTSILFDAGTNSTAAATIRQQAPLLKLPAKLFGQTADASLLWRCVDVVIGPAVSSLATRAMALGAACVLVADSGSAEDLAAEVALRGLGGVVHNPLELESTLRRATRRAPSPDGARNLADMITVILRDAVAIARERRPIARPPEAPPAPAPHAAPGPAATAAAAGDLEDLGGNAPPPRPSPMQGGAATRERLAQRTAAMHQAQAQAEADSQQAATARARGDVVAAEALSKRADRERARMHALLDEMAALERELAEVRKPAAPQVPRGKPAPVGDRIDDELAALKRRAGAPAPANTATANRAANPLDAELAKLKQKMGPKGQG